MLCTERGTGWESGNLLAVYHGRASSPLWASVSLLSNGTMTEHYRVQFLAWGGLSTALGQALQADMAKEGCGSPGRGVPRPQL